MAKWSWETDPGGVWVQMEPEQEAQRIELSGPDRLTERSEKWIPLAIKYGKSKGVPPALIMAVIYAETGGDPTLTNFCCDGLMALARDVWAPALGLEPGELMDPETNIMAGTHVLQLALAESDGDIPTAASLYNAGPAKGGGPKLNQSSVWGMAENMPAVPWSGYIEKVVRAYNWWTQHEGLQGGAPPGPGPGPEIPPPPLTVSSTKSSGVIVGALAAVAGFFGLREALKKKRKR